MGTSTEMLMCEDMTSCTDLVVSHSQPHPFATLGGAGYVRLLTLPVAMLSMRSLHSATVLYSNSYYIVAASIFLVSAASCKAICRVASVRTSDYSQPKVTRPSNTTRAN